MGERVSWANKTGAKDGVMGVERYQRARLLADGPMSEVWLARDTHTQKSVVLKIMMTISEDDKRNEKARERFLREIAIARGLHHPHILPLLDDGEMNYNGLVVPYLVSPYVREGSLADLVKATPPWETWSLPQIADVVMQAAESLYYLHTRVPHIMHQDVKPGNFLYHTVQTAERAVYVYLCDFGISRLQGRLHTMASELLGTFAYMPPEQAERKVDPASDQYALAVMTCFLLTGKLPLQASTNEEYIQAHLHDQPLLPGALDPQRFDSPVIDAVLLRALAKKPSQRFPTIIDFAHALQEAITKLAVAHANARTERLDPAYAATAYPADRVRPVPSFQPPSIPTIPTLPTLPTVPSPRSQPAPGAAELIPLSSEPLDDNDERPPLDEPLPAKPPRTPPAQSEESVLTVLSLHQVKHYDLSTRPKQLAWSPDGDCLACALYSHVPLVLCRDGSMQEVRTRGAEQASCISWSPLWRAPQVVAVSARGEIRFWESAAQSELPLLLHFDVRAIDGLDWSAQGQLAVWIEQHIRLYPLSYNALALQRPPSPQHLLTGAMRCSGPGVLRWSPDGALLAAGAVNGEVLCWRPAHEADVWRVAAPGQKVVALAWSPDSTILAVALRDNRVVGWNTQTRERLFVWEKLPVMPRALSISAARRITIASSEPRLLSGLSGESAPTSSIQGQLLATWSPTRPELATLDDRYERTLMIWGE